MYEQMERVSVAKVWPMSAWGKRMVSGMSQV